MLVTEENCKDGDGLVIEGEECELTTGGGDEVGITVVESMIMGAEGVFEGASEVLGFWGGLFLIIGHSLLRCPSFLQRKHAFSPPKVSTGQEITSSIMQMVTSLGISLPGFRARRILASR
jgi:hypothetical protein